MFIIGEAVIDESVRDARFACDLQKCKGACCSLEGGRGAPLLDEEVERIRESYPAIRPLLSERSIRQIEATGMVEGRAGDYATPCIGDRECVFAFFENGIARCAFEQAYHQGTSRWRKPLSCHLFPIRVRRFGQDFVQYEQIDECMPARQRGVSENVPLHGFLREALVRKFGPAWYTKLSTACNDGHGEDGNG